MSPRVLRRASAAIAAISAMIFGVGLIAAAPALAATPPSVRLANVYTGKCLDSYNWAIGGNRATQTTCGESGHGTTQLWKIYVYSGYVKIKVGYNTGYCLNAVVGTGGVTIKQCQSNDLNQNWFETHVNALWNIYENSGNDRCLDASAAYGVRVVTCSSTNTHQWWA